jgi:MFS family permease
MIWGPIGDRFGRVRTLSLTILCYSVFTLAGAFATSVWQLAMFRLLAGIGVGGEWTLGSTFVAEEWPERLRARGAGYMQTGYYIGMLIASQLNTTIGAAFGWRALFLIGGTPALLVFWIRRGVREPERWSPSESAAGSLARLFTGTLRRRTIVNAILYNISIVGLWAGSVYVPSAVSYLGGQAGLDAAAIVHRSSLAMALLSIGTIVGAVIVPRLAQRFGRRPVHAVFLALMGTAIVVVFGVAFYARHDALTWFVSLTILLGLGGANFTTYMFWLPEQYPTACRASALGFIGSVGRFVGAGVTFLVGWGVSTLGTIGVPVALTAVAFAVGLLLVPLTIETTGRPLPE